MFECRAKIGKITPASDTGGLSEYFALLPEGVEMIVATTGVATLVHEDAEKAFSMYPAAAEALATQECDVIFAAGSLVFSHMGWDRTQEMIQKIRQKVGIPVVTDLEGHFDALRALGAKKIVIATPYPEARTEERKRLCESVGFEVLNTKSLGIARRLDLQLLPAYASYRTAKQAFLEAPEADAIYISCPAWPTLNNIEKLERDTGKPVVYAAAADIWSLLRILHIKEPIKGYGRLLELV